MPIESLKNKKLLVVSDVHSNIVALETVLEEEKHQFEGVINLGDIVGYGPNPNSTMDRLLEFPNISVCGNHDVVACEAKPPTNFNLYAYTIIMWTRKLLSKKNKEFLSALPYPHIQEDFCFAHGNHENCEEYVLAKEATVPIIEYLKKNSASFCLIGHTHLPVIYRIPKMEAATSSYQELEELHPEDFPHEIDLDPDYFYVINAGSVGQPRDHDPRASYGILDTHGAHPKLTIKRLAYKIPVVQESMVEFGLPAPMVQRLAKGI